MDECKSHNLFSYVNIQEGYPVVENKNADFETRKIQIKRNEEQNHTNHEDQLKASRDVRWLQLCVYMYICLKNNA